MWGEFTRRRYLAAVGTAAAIAGCNDNNDETPSAATEEPPTETLVLPTETKTTVSPTPNGTPTQQLVIPAGAKHTKSRVPIYNGIEWYDGGRLVIEDDAGFGLTDTETTA